MNSKMKFTLYYLLATTPVLTSAHFLSKYTPLGCYSEPEGRRALGPLHYTSGVDGVGNMTLTLCSDLCKSYKFFATENFDECYCGNLLVGGASTDTAKCASPCRGNTEEICGGQGTLSLYSDDSITAPNIPPKSVPYSFSGTGCQTDGLNGMRALSDDSFTDMEGMTNEACANFCSSKNYPLFGTENSIECWCGHTVSPDSQPALLEECSMQCSGRKTELCGGYGKMNLYNYAPVVEPLVVALQIDILSTVGEPLAPTRVVALADTPTSSAVEGITTPASVLIQSFVAPVDFAAPTIVIHEDSSSMMLMAEAMGFGPSISSPAITPTPGPLEYLGCFKHRRKYKMITIVTSKTMNPSLCAEFAQAFLTANPPTTYTYIGVEAGSKCLGATSIPPNPASLVGRKACPKKCVGSPTQSCGGKLQYNLYASAGAPTYPGDILTRTIN